MLTTLSIRDFVLIDQLNLELGMGLTTLTGETGAGKSILLDALGVCIGLRASPEMIRRGARQASITAVFDVPDRHPVFHELRELGLQIDDSELVLRRVIQADGRSRAFVNDEPTSAGTLRRLGETMVEIQGQFDLHGLLSRPITAACSTPLPAMAVCFRRFSAVTRRCRRPRPSWSARAKTSPGPA